MNHDNNPVAVRYVDEIQAVLELIISNRHMFVNDDSITTNDIPYEWADMLTSFDQIRNYLKSAPATLQNLHTNLKLHYDNLIDQRDSMHKLMQSKEWESVHLQQCVLEILQDTNNFLKSYIQEIPNVSTIIECNNTIISKLSD